MEYDLVRPSFPITQDATSDDCIEFAQALITECLENHTECSSPISSRRTRPSNSNIMSQLQRGMRDLLHKDDPVPLPTRLLDIGPLGADHIRLIETATSPPPEGARHACLSHCWGPSQPLTTTTSTLIDRKTSIPWSTLPKTFQDAADFARRLSIPYLWIDSLCIVQDSKEDWRRESARMASIYENWFVCLAATASPGHHGGLYFAQPNPAASKYVISLKEDGEEHDIFVRTTALRHPEMTRQFPPPGTAVEKGFPLLQRGWVFQELLLAPRILHFWPHELYFQCMEMHACECGASLRDGIEKTSHFEALGHGRGFADVNPVDDSDDDDDDDDDDDSHRRRRRRRRQPIDRKLLGRQQRWRDMVTQYSRLQLTFGSYRLLALAGLAKQMMRVRGGKYLAGLWEDSLFEDLCWEVVKMGPSEPIAAPKDAGAYIAPSWSWASVLKPVQYGNDLTNRRREREFVPDAKLTSAKVANADAHEPTGQVMSGYLKLSATWTQTYPDKEKRPQPESREDVYYVLLATAGLSVYWLVLERVDAEHYRRTGFVNGDWTSGPDGMGGKGRKTFTII